MTLEIINYELQTRLNDEVSINHQIYLVNYLIEMTTAPVINDFIGWMRENNRVARAVRFLVQIFFT